MKRFVLDTSVVVAGMRSPKGASARLLEAAALNEVTLVVTNAVALEYEAVCSRDEHLSAAGLTAGEAAEFVAGLIAIADPVAVWYKLRPQLRDPDDEFVLEAAVNGGVDALVTFNVADFEAGALRYGIDTLRPAEALKAMEQDR